jgi:hypothetical protein
MTQELLQEGQIAGMWIVYMIIKKLTTPFKDTEAFKLGIIDAKGNVLRKRHTLKTRQEKDAYTSLDTLVFNLKKMIERLPGGQSRLASFAAALYLIRETRNYELLNSNTDMLYEGFVEYLNDFTVTEDIKKKLVLVDIAEDNIIDFEPKVRENINDEFKKMFGE